MPIKIGRAASYKPGLIWEGSFFIYSSLALVNREITAEILATGRYDLGLLPYSEDQFSPAGHPHFEALGRCMGRKPEEVAAHVRHRWPPSFDPVPEGRFVLIQPWEFGSLPLEWVEPIQEKVDEVWVPSRYVRETYLRAGIPEERVAVVPNGIRPESFHPGCPPLPLPADKGFKFLYVGGTILRKGIDVLLKAYCQEFSPEEDAALVIKDMGGDSFYQGQTLEQHIAQLQSLPGTPSILYSKDSISEGQMGSLYTSCDCLVHPYRGEGYGLPIAEAMACGLPVIVTGYGACLDYCNEGNAYLVPSSPVRSEEARVGSIPTVDYPFWAEPDLKVLRRQMRHVFEHREEARAKGWQAHRDMHSHHTWSHAAQAAMDRLTVLGERAPIKAGKGARPWTPTHQSPSTAAIKDRGIELARAGEADAAIADLQEAISQGENHWDVYNALAVAYFHKGDLIRAKAVLKDALRIFPDCGDLYHNLAFLLAREGHLSEAIEHAIRAARLKPESPEVYDTLKRLRDRLEAARTKQGGKKKKKRRSHPSASRLDAETRDKLSRADAVLKAIQAGKEQPRISLCMIVKDEEAFLEGCLESVQGLVDEIVLVDTGSSDFTLDIARRFGAKIFSYPWQEDFAKARNESLRHASGDWILWLDADERLSPGSASQLRPLVKQASRQAGAFTLNVKSAGGEEGREVFVHPAPRLFRNLEGIGFEGRIHEQIVPSIQALGKEILPCDLEIEHLGYLPGVRHERGKDDRNLRLLHQAAGEQPEDLFRIFNLGNTYYTLGNRANAEKHLSQVIEKADASHSFAPLAYSLLMTYRYQERHGEEGLHLYEKARTLGLDSPGLRFAAGHCLLTLGQYEKAAVEFRQAMAFDAGENIGDEGASGIKARYGLTLALLGMENYDEAEQECLEVVREAPDFLDGLYTLGMIYWHAGRAEKAQEVFADLCRRAPWYQNSLPTGRPASSKQSDKNPTTESGRPAKISLCMIVKDEEAFLEGCLESVQGLVDEIVLVDTGSSDFTLDIARRFGAKIFSYPWQEDFAKARNESLRHASGDWILWLDADERLSPEAIPAIRKAVQGGNADCYYISFLNYMEGPDSPDVFVHRAFRLFRNLEGIGFEGRIHEQIGKSFERLRARFGELDTPIIHLGYQKDIMRERGKSDRTIGFLRREVEENPDDDFQMFNLGNAYYGQGDHENARFWLEKSLEKADSGQDHVPVLFVLLSTSCRILGDTEKALWCCEQACAQGIEHPGIESAAGECYLILGQYGKAIEAFQKAIDLGNRPGSQYLGDITMSGYKAHYGLARAYLSLGRAKEAIDHATHALKDRPDFANARYLLALSLKHLGQVPEAEQAFLETLRCDPEHWPTLYDLAELYFERKEYHRAASLLEQLVGSPGMNATVLFRLAFCCEQSGDISSAIEHYRNSLQLSPDQAESGLNLGRLLMQQGEAEEAEQALLRAVQAAPAFTEAHLCLAQLYDMTGRHEEALQTYQHAVNLDPHNGNGYFLLGDFLYRLGCYAEAMAIYEKGLEILPDHREGWFVMGNCYFQVGAYEAAAMAYQLVLSHMPDHAGALNNLALTGEHLLCSGDSPHTCQDTEAA